MTKTGNTMQVIKESFRCIEDRYDMHADNVEDTCNESSSFYDLIVNGFHFGYMQGMKAVMEKQQNPSIGSGQK